MRATDGPIVYECQNCGTDHSIPISDLGTCRECGKTRFNVVVDK